MRTDVQPVGVPLELGNGPVVAHVVQGHWRDEPALHERSRRRLHVEGVPVSSDQEYLGVGRGHDIGSQALKSCDVVACKGNRTDQDTVVQSIL